MNSGIADYHYLCPADPKIASVAESLKRGGSSRRSDQGEVWRQMGKKRSDFQAEAPTVSMTDVYDSARLSMDECLDHIRIQPNQVGLACAVNDQTAGIELFEDTGVFKQFFDRLIRAYAAEVVNENYIATTVPDRDAFRTPLERFVRLDCDEYDAVGSGKELRFAAGSLNGSALFVNERLLHMVMLRKNVRAFH